MAKFTLIEFDKKLAEAGKTICTRDGKDVRLLCMDRRDIFNIVALVPDKHLNDRILEYYDNGRLSKLFKTSDDLMIKIEEEN